MTHDYKRNGTLDLFAALNVGSGEVLHDTRRSHTGRDVLAFFRWIDMHVDPDLELQVILDNLSAHKRRRRWHLPFLESGRRDSNPRPSPRQSIEARAAYLQLCKMMEHNPGVRLTTANCY
jgi:hypothetical protein